MSSDFLLCSITSRAKPRGHRIVFFHSEQRSDFYLIIRHEDRIVPNTIQKLDTLLAYALDSNMATAEAAVATKIEAWTLWEYSIFVQKCEAILNVASLLLLTNSLGFGILYEPRLTARLFKTLDTRQSNTHEKSMHSIFTKWSLEPPEGISAFRAFVGNTERVFSAVKEELDDFFRGNSRIILDCRVCSILKTLPGCRVSRHSGSKMKHSSYRTRFSIRSVF